MACYCLVGQSFRWGPDESSADEQWLHSNVNRLNATELKLQDA